MADPPLTHRVFFWSYLATLSQVIPEVTTLSTPIPWVTPHGWYLGYPVYGLHVLALAGLAFRWPIQGFRTLLAYGGLFGLYEGYLIKQLWNPNWAADVTASVGGVRLFHTLTLVFFLHPLFAFVLPLLLAERFLLRPGRLSVLLPERARGFRGTLLLFAVVAAYLWMIVGANLPSRADLHIPLVSMVVLVGLGLVWRVGVNGHRFRLEELLPRGRWLMGVVGALLVSYPIITRTVRWTALPTKPLPHLLVLGVYLFLVATIVSLTPAHSPAPIGDRSGWPRRRIVTTVGAIVGVFLLVTWLHAPFTHPGQTVALVSFVIVGAINAVVLAASLRHRLVGAVDSTPSA